MVRGMKIILTSLIVILLTPFIFEETPLDTNSLKVEIPCLYERVTDGIYYLNRSIEDVIQILKETRTDFIFRGWWRWYPCPEDANISLPQEYPSNYVENCVKRGYTYEDLREAVSRIKEEIPGIVFCGAIPAQIITRLVWNPLTMDFFYTNETWAMALDPSKWGLNKSKEEFQYQFAKWHLWVDPNSTLDEYDYRNVSSYFPDITNKEFQELLLSWAIKQIDCGVDAIWIDMLFSQASMLYGITQDIYHPAVKESYEAACKIIDRIHEYGNSMEKYIYVGTWSTCVIYPYEKPSLDFLTASPSSREVYEIELNETKWDERIEAVREKFGDIPYFAFIDWASTTHTPLGIFSQYLSKEKQREFIRKADVFFSKKGISFIYPVHGGWMGNDAEVLSYGISKVYDSLAPEFETYGSIVELAQNKSKGNPLIYIEKPRSYLYIFDRETIPLKIPIILGRITVIVDAYDEDGIDKIEFYIDDIIKFTDCDIPYQWLWNEFAIGRHEIRAIAYDNERNKVEDKINVMIFNFGERNEKNGQNSLWYCLYFNCLRPALHLIYN